MGLHRALAQSPARIVVKGLKHVTPQRNGSQVRKSQNYLDVGAAQSQSGGGGTTVLVQGFVYEWHLLGNYILDSLNGFAPEPLDTITDVVLTYRPKPKSKAGKKRKRKEKKIANA